MGRRKGRCRSRSIRSGAIRRNAGAGLTARLARRRVSGGIVACGNCRCFASNMDGSRLGVISTSATEGLTGSTVLVSLLTTLLVLVCVSFEFRVASNIYTIITLTRSVLLLYKVCSMLEVGVSAGFVTTLLAILNCSVGGAVIVFSEVERGAEGTGGRACSRVTGGDVGRALGEDMGAAVAALLAVNTICILNMASVERFSLPVVVNVVIKACSSVFISNSV